MEGHPGGLGRGGAVTRQRGARDVVQTEEHGDDTRQVEAALTAGASTAEENVVDGVRVERRHLLQDRTDDLGRQVVGSQVDQRPSAGAADGGASGSDDDGLGHAVQPNRRAACQHGGVRHVFECPMRWADLDLLGHVNNAVYVDYLQEARVDMLRVHARDRRADDLAEGVVVVRHEVQYVAPLAVPVRAGADRDVGDRDQGGELHPRLRGVRRDRRRAAGLPARDDRAHAVRLRHRTSARLAPPERADPRGVPRRAAPGAVRRPGGAAGGRR